MLLTAKEMEALCVFHSGTLSETLSKLREALTDETRSQLKTVDINSLIEKLSGMKDGEAVSLAFEKES
jgi:hypothetical protein